MFKRSIWIPPKMNDASICQDSPITTRGKMIASVSSAFDDDWYILGNSTVNLNKWLIGILALLCFTCASAGEAFIFNDPGLTAYKEDDSIAGIYSATSEQFSCFFIFSQKQPSSGVADKDGFSDTKILTFSPGDGSLLFKDRDKRFDINGDLYRRDQKWVIRTSRAQAGCENSAGTFTFNLGNSSARIYWIVQKIPAVGIRLVKNKTYLYDYDAGKYVVRKGYLTRWDGVLLLRTKDEFSYVRFVDPRADLKSSGRVTTGWVHSSDLANPLPPSK
jgi:hypothetical protein